MSGITINKLVELKQLIGELVALNDKDAVDLAREKNDATLNSLIAASNELIVLKECVNCGGIFEPEIDFEVYCSRACEAAI